MKHRKIPNDWVEYVAYGYMMVLKRSNGEAWMFWPFSKLAGKPDEECYRKMHYNRSTKTYSLPKGKRA